jgi:transcription antitermination factor NusG
VNEKFKIKNKGYMADGTIATVLSGPDSDGDYKAITDDDEANIVYTAPFQMEKIENTQPTFNIGDVVKIIDKSSGFSGMVGKINAGPDADGDFTVVFDEDDGEEWTYAKPDEMEKAEKPQADIKFAEGDTVKISGPSAYNNSSFTGYTGTITSVSDDGMFAGVRIDGTGGDTTLTYSVINLSKSEKDEIDSLTWEPEPEVSAPTESQFKKGDRIEVSGEFPSLIGKKGTIIQTSSKYGFVSVQLDDNTAPSSFPVTALKKIDETQQTEEFNLGDMVEVTNDSLSSYGQKGKVTDMDVNMLVVQDSTTGDVFFAKKANVKKIG